MNGLEEAVEKGGEVTQVESLDRSGIQFVGLCLFQCPFDDSLIIEALGEGNDFGTYEYVSPGDFPFQADASRRYTG